MNRFTAVKGTGGVSVKPDLIIISMDLESHQYNYEETMKLATESINALYQGF